ncbi:phage tail protein [Cronobacter sakazakii]|uniref:gp53-like domain-containing protein n=1 Tax=Cronobacter sakazakii TaxID=28141 RepID=UPI0027B8599B|nr:phage tail protein [Cronobacter sakazakii]MDQ1934152.1 phage tail protein [Cronobacter sakazakii]MDQ1959372.1 phage tail protein [Cronobacter sakazakii]MDQ1992880.1 phage tail protein [Cronobacter sakazakii]
MATNNFKPFATAANANVTAQADWESLPALLSGFTAGKASSAQVNKAIRQASFIAAALAQYTANKSGLDVLDDGDLNGFIAKMSAAFGKDFQALDATLTALAGLTTGANKLPYFTGTDTASQTNLTSVGRDIIGKGTIADILTYLGLKEAAKRDVGTGANQIPDMNSFASGSSGAGQWFRLPSGVLVQWGVIANTLTTGGYNVTYPTPFSESPSFSLAVTASMPILATAVNTTTTVLNGVSTWNLSGARQTNSVLWIAIGK